MSKLTKDDLYTFRDFCLKWMDKLQLSDWDCAFRLEKIPGCNARVSGNVCTRKALFRLSTEHEDFVDLEDSAKHECIELLLMDISVMALNYYSDAYVDNEVHRVVNRLMKALK